MDSKRIVKMLDLVSHLQHEEHVEGMEEEKHEEHDEHEEEYDEHVWTSPKNAIEIVYGLNKRMCALDQKHASKFNENTENYIKQIASVDSSFKQIVKQAKRKDIVVGDRFCFILRKNMVLHIVLHFQDVLNRLNQVHLLFPI